MFRMTINDGYVIFNGQLESTKWPCSIAVKELCHGHHLYNEPDLVVDKMGSLNHSPPP